MMLRSIARLTYHRTTQGSIGRTIASSPINTSSAIPTFRQRDRRFFGGDGVGFSASSETDVGVLASCIAHYPPVLGYTNRALGSQKAYRKPHQKIALARQCSVARGKLRRIGLSANRIPQ